MDYYTLSPHQDTNGNDYGTWQPDSTVNNKIHVDSNIASNWKYRQYLQNNASHIMKYNTMESIYTSGNNPYTVKNTEPTNTSPILLSSNKNSSSPSFGLHNSDLKQDYMTRENLNMRKVAPTIPTNF